MSVTSCVSQDRLLRKPCWRSYSKVGDYVCGNNMLTAKTRSDRDFEMSLCYTPTAFSCLEEIKYNINHCLELAPSFLKMYNITMF